MPQGFTAPDGTFYQWNKPTPPTQADIDAIVAYHARTHQKAQPIDPFAGGGPIGVRPVGSGPSGNGDPLGDPADDPTQPKPPPLPYKAQKPKAKAYDPATASAGILTPAENARRAKLRATGAKTPDPLLGALGFHPPAEFVDTRQQDFQDEQASSPLNRMIDPKRAAKADHDLAQRKIARAGATNAWNAEQASKPLVADDFNGLRFTYDAFRRANDEGTVVQGRDGQPIELGQAMKEITAKTGKRNFGYTASQSSIEGRQTRQEAQGHAERAKNSVVGRFVEAQRSGDARGANATAGWGLVGSGVDKVFHGIGAAADVLDSGALGNAIEGATRADGGALTPSEKKQLMAEFGRRALATVANAGGFLGVGADAAAATKAGHAIMNAGFGADLGLAGTKTASVFADPYRSDEERTAAATEFAVNAAMMAAPAALGQIARLIPEGTKRAAVEAVQALVAGSRDPAEAVARATKRWKLPPAEAKSVVDAIVEGGHAGPKSALRAVDGLSDDQYGELLSKLPQNVRDTMEGQLAGGDSEGARQTLAQHLAGNPVSHEQRFEGQLSKAVKAGIITEEQGLDIADRWGAVADAWASRQPGRTRESFYEQHAPKVALDQAVPDGALHQIEGLLTGAEAHPTFGGKKVLPDVAGWLEDYARQHPVFDRPVGELGDDELVRGLAEHTTRELAAWRKVQTAYKDFYGDDIVKTANPELQAWAQRVHGRDLTDGEVRFYHLLSSFASPAANPEFDSSTGLKLFDRWMRDGTISGFGDRQRTRWDVDAKGKKFDTGEPLFDADGRPQPSQVSKTYAIDSLDKIKPLIDKLGVDGAMDWLGSRHSWQEIVDTLGLDAKKLKAHEYLNKEHGGFGVFGVTGPKLGSYILNRWQEFGTVTKDMWYARSMARLAGEPLVEGAEAIKEPWGLTKEGLRKRRLADEAWGMVGDALGMTPAGVQQAMWDAEQMLYGKMGVPREPAYVSAGLAKGIADVDRGNRLGSVVSDVWDAARADARGVRGEGQPLPGESGGGAAGGPLHQLGPDGRVVKGAVVFNDGEKPVLHLFTGVSDVSTVLHESAHVWRRTLSAEDNLVLHEAIGARIGSTKFEERFARAAERYLYDGSAPTPASQPLFDRFRKWLGDIYGKVAGSEIEEAVQPEVRGVLDRMFGEARAVEPAPEAAPKAPRARGKKAPAIVAAPDSFEGRTRAAVADAPPEVQAQVEAHLAAGEMSAADALARTHEASKAPQPAPEPPLAPPEPQPTAQAPQEATPPTAVPEGVDPGKLTIGNANAMLEKMGEAPLATVPQSWGEVEARAQALDAQILGDTSKITKAAKLSANGTIAPEERLVLHAKAQSLLEERAGIDAQIQGAAADGDVRALQFRKDGIDGELKDVLGVLYKSGSQDGRNLAFHRYTLQGELTDAQLLERAERTTRGRLTGEQRDALIESNKAVRMASALVSEAKAAREAAAEKVAAAAANGELRRLSFSKEDLAACPLLTKLS